MFVDADYVVLTADPSIKFGSRLRRGIHLGQSEVNHFGAVKAQVRTKKGKNEIIQINLYKGTKQILQVFAGSGRVATHSGTCQHSRCREAASLLIWWLPSMSVSQFGLPVKCAILIPLAKPRHGEQTRQNRSMYMVLPAGIDQYLKVISI